MSGEDDLPLFRWSTEARRRQQERRQRSQRRLSRARRTLGAATLAVVLLCAPAIVGPTPRLVWNATASAPIGLYRIDPRGGVERGMLVAATLPPSAATLAAERGYLPLGVPVIKHVAAIGDDRVCARGAVLIASDRLVVRRLARDRTGRSLPWWRGCRRLLADEILLLNPARADSFDGRYFGPTLRTDVIGAAVPLWLR